jgi:hypothetical protein
MPGLIGDYYVDDTAKIGAQNTMLITLLNQQLASWAYAAMLNDFSDVMAAFLSAGFDSRNRAIGSSE